MSALPSNHEVPLDLPRTIVAMPFRSLLLNTTVAYQPHILARFSFTRSFIAKLKADIAVKKSEAAKLALTEQAQADGEY